MKWLPLQLSPFVVPCLTLLALVLITTGVWAQAPGDFRVEGLSGGIAPWESSLRLTIDPSGTANFYRRATHDDEFLLDRSFTLTSAERNSIHAAVIANGFFALDSLYDGDKSDGRVLELTITSDGVTHYVRAENLVVTALKNIVQTINAVTPDTLDLEYDESIFSTISKSGWQDLREMLLTGSGTSVTQEVCKIKVKLKIQISGEGANAAAAAAIKNEIQAKWNSPNLKYKDWCPVEFEVEMKVGGDAAKGFHQVELTKDKKHISYVNNPIPTANNGGSGSGKWEHPDIPPPGNAFAHEAGHLMGCKDEYEVVSRNPYRTRPKPGHTHDIMADLSKGGTPSLPTQAQINKIVEDAGITCPDFCCVFDPIPLPPMVCFIGQSVDLVITVTNRDPATPLQILQAMSPNPHFSVFPPNSSIPPLQSREFVVTFTPPGMGIQETEIIFIRQQGAEDPIQDRFPLQGMAFGRAFISGSVRIDHNGDGILQPFETTPALPGTIQVALLEAAAAAYGEVIHLSEVGETGGYGMEVHILEPNRLYAVAASVPGHFHTLPSDPFHRIVLNDGDAVSGLDFGFFQPGSIAGFAFNDLNFDGVRDPGEPPLVGDRISILVEHVPPVFDYFPSVAEMELRMEGFPPLPVRPSGPTLVRKGDPRVVGGVPQIPIELLQLNLVSINPIQFDVRLDSSKRSFGLVEGIGPSQFPATSFFDVFFEVTLPPMGVFKNHDDSALRVQTDHGCVQDLPPVPPSGCDYRHEGGGCFGIYQGGIRVGEICYAAHAPGYTYRQEFGCTDTVRRVSDTIWVCTDDSGRFIFDGLPPGVFTVQSRLPDGWIYTTYPDPIVVTSGTFVANVPVGKKQPLSPPQPDLASWNGAANNQNKNNCYNYATNKKTNTFAQPGKASGRKWSALSCDSVKAAALRDGLVEVAKDSPCVNGHKVALVVDPGNDYHWYRQNKDGKWTHKPGGTKATDKDGAGNVITDPETANRQSGGLNYTEFCGYFCVTKVTNVAKPPGVFAGDDPDDEDGIDAWLRGEIEDNSSESRVTAMGGIKATKLLYSGVENLFQNYTGADVDSIQEKLSGLSIVPDPEWEGQLGYQGFWLENTSLPGIPPNMWVRDGAIEATDENGTTYYSDSKGLEQWLLQKFSETSTVQVTISRNWNMISNPVTRENNAVASVYPDATPPAFSYAAGVGYEVSASLQNGKGYWLRFAADGTAEVEGVLINSISIPVVTGWNMIGARSTSTATSSIVSDPAGIVRSRYFGYNSSSGYFPTDMIDPGRAYWVKVSEPGDLLLADGSAGRNASTEKVLEGFNSLTITDARGLAQSLYFGHSQGSGFDVTQFRLPPLPPGDGFDARFTSQQLIEIVSDAGSRDLPIDLTSADYPVRIGWKGAQGARVRASLLVSDDHEMQLSGNGSAILDGRPSRVILRASGIASVERPSSYRLHQNYPNPFNPTTTIRFDLPEPTGVTLTVFNVVGQAVATVLNGKHFEAGQHEVVFDAAGLVSGAYLYRIQANSFRDERVMMILK